ncbi:uncharacterized protein LOC100831059 isoform X1 [Brachypodium distachyon]|uniref:Uncharacterized protein n=1 Tax=Brachypodium distachyon TaxID=15368 RepID=A0A0Q3EFF6_BRADI|nr:uncharacterized protein LOC100831059 isoform X1 [Brachypodium distachyon]KQJ86407.1 hypothetical protein BRADI_4g05271v3 [Brachypodium distachyon]|eukprot:XP_024318449.1 uncharacterized protein LOC100831059 isoform X1 [Brachypodium distachyon]
MATQKASSVSGKKKDSSYDSKWEEVVCINSYALFMGYLSMAVRGVGVLVLTWSTVVLLGGFVSMLQKKDFWSLTIITLVQTAGVFDVSLNEKLKYIRKSYLGFLSAIYATVVIRKNRVWHIRRKRRIADNNDPSLPRLLLAVVVLFVQQFVFAVILCPLAALYLCGLVITGGISLWRLIQRDYGKVDGDVNLQPALNVLYSLALFQGVLFCYRFFSYSAGDGLVSKVAEEYQLGKTARKSVKEYLRQTRNGCAKDPSFVKERNLVTYAVGMMKCESSGSFLSGARILDALLTQPNLEEQHSMIAQLIGSASSSNIVEKLLRALDSRSRRDKEITELAARIVAHLASEIRLKQFPQGIPCISSLLETSQRQDDDDSVPSGEFKVLMVQGLVILDGLAADKHNCTAICEAQSLLSKVMAPISSDLLHLIDHGEWSNIVAASLQVMSRLVTTPGSSDNELHSQMLKNTDVISSMEKILECEICDDKLKILAIKILTKLPMNAASSVGNESGVKFIKALAKIFTSDTKDSSVRKLAGEALAMLSESNATIFLKENGSVVDDLRIMLSCYGNNSYRISAAETLKHLCMYYKENDDYFRKLMGAMKDVTLEVLTEILPRGSTVKEVQAGNEIDKDKYQAPGADLEDGHDGSVDSENNCLNKITSSVQQKDEKPDERKLHAALLSLSAAIFDKLISEGHDLAPLVDAIASGDAAFSFAWKLKEMVEINSKPTANCLIIMKIISKMVMSMMKQRAWSVKEDLESLDSLMLSLSSASKNMLALEGFMIFASADGHAMKYFGTFSSLVNEAQKLLEKIKMERQLATVPAFCDNENQEIE